MKRLFVLIVAFGLGGARPCEGGSFCDDLTVAGLEGKFVTVHTADARPDNFQHGVVVSITPDTITTRLGAVFSYTQCRHVLAVTVDSDAYGMPKDVKPSPSP
jgi:hypothetical protein